MGLFLPLNILALAGRAHTPSAGARRHPAQAEIKFKSKRAVLRSDASRPGSWYDVLGRAGREERKRGREDAKNGTDLRSSSIPIFASRLLVVFNYDFGLRWLSLALLGGRWTVDGQRCFEQRSAVL